MNIDMQGRTPEQIERALQCAAWSFALMAATMVIGLIVKLCGG